jgi:hypothetical protein
MFIARNPRIKAGLNTLNPGNPTEPLARSILVDDFYGVSTTSDQRQRETTT